MKFPSVPWRSRPWWRTLTAFILLAGLALSAFGGDAWAGYQADQAAKGFDNVALGVASALDTEVQRDLDLERALENLVVTSPDPSNAQIGAWLEATDLKANYRGTAGITFIQRVPAAGLAGYEAAVSADPVPGYGPGPYPVVAAGPRPFYCLVRFGLLSTAVSFPPGLDLCSRQIPGVGTSLIGAALARAATSGTTQLASVRGLVRVASPAGAKMLSQEADEELAMVPVYKGGTKPATAAGRDRDLTGWVMGSFDGAGLLAPTLQGTTGLSVVVRSSGAVLVSTGRPAGPGWLELTRDLPANVGLSVTIAHRSAATPQLQGTLLGGLGALLTMVVFAFAVYLGRSRERALRQVSERPRELRHQALHDALTGLPNRALLFDRAEQLLARARRHPSAVGALYIDLDNFKDVNDSFGHGTGDQLLRAVAERLQACLRDTDTVGRLGGDEFLVLTEDLDPAGPVGDGRDGAEGEKAAGAGPELVAQRIVAALAEPFELDGSPPVTLAVKASVGIAAGVRAGAEELIRDADVALYQAKEAGKGRYTVFRPEMQAAVQDRMALEMDLHHAVERDELFVLYQPIFDLDRRTTKAVEALVRWRHPTRGVIAPADFIPIAEQSGTIVAIGRFVLDQACAQAARWRRDGFPLDVSVNVSVAEFDSGDFVEGVRATLGRHDLDPASLTLEITESVLMRDTSVTATLLTQLEALGVRIAIDDFGTGYSSLAYLRQFPIHSLKIDRGFVARATTSPQAAVLVHALVQLGRALGIETLAEGIESDTQLAQLREEHCDRGQGFLFARPLPAEEVEAFVAAVAVKA